MRMCWGIRSCLLTRQGTGRCATRASIRNYYEQTGSTIRKYYYAGGQRVAMRENSTVYYLLTDHLGSTAITTDGSGNRVAELRYKAWSETRYTWGTTPTGFRYTGQRQEEGLGLYRMGARWVDPYGQHPALQLCGPVKSPSALVQGARARRR